MLKCSLAPVTLFTLLVTGFALNQLGWFSSRVTASSPRPAESRSAAEAEAWASEAAVRYRSCQPSHWRAFVLQR